MQIVLLRHGKPKVRTDVWLSPAELAAWVAKYNGSGIDPGFPPPGEAIAQAKECCLAVCSDLPRSKESAEALGIKRVGVCETLFRELDMPYASWRAPRLTVLAWAILFRLLWVLGYSANGESLPACRDRASLCAQRLAALAAEHGKVVFVGHGALNWLIARRLKRAGWSGPKKSPRRYWDFAVYSKEGGR